MIARERIMETARQVYRSFGFSPIDTPALEYLEILAGKGSEETDRQLYRFQDHGKRWVGLRFDLTVPLARFAAQHVGELGTPFKRYHIASVWRGENTQLGRYREFMQCDFDTIGTLSTVADIETILVVHELLQAIGIERFTIHVNHRQILNGLLEKLELAEQATVVLRCLDKLPKIGRDAVQEEMRTVGVAAEKSTEILQLSELSGENEEILRGLSKLAQGNSRAEEGLAKLEEIFQGVQVAGVAPGRLRIDPSIARGLDYYTGTVIETFLDDLPRIGSVCSGGRYDNLAELYTSQVLPGIGASLGLDRMLAALEELNLLEKVRTPAEVFVPFFAADRLHDYLHLTNALRRLGWGVEMYPEPRKLGSQLKYADRRGFACAIIVGEDEFQASTCQVKDLRSGESQEVRHGGDVSRIADVLRTLLRPESMPSV